jgi:hypoxanthine phosphoribosyltransferase
MKNDIEQVFYSEETIARRVRELGQQITADYKGQQPLLLGVLKGSFIFFADLARSIDLKCELDFVACSSYGFGTQTSGEVRLTKSVGVNIENRHVIAIEDILDTGTTINFLKNYLLTLKPASVKVCTLLDKPARRKVPFTADYVGFECEDEFFVGYGLDYAEYYRNLPYIGSLKPEIYA